jgi:YggT family protein
VRRWRERPSPLHLLGRVGCPLYLNTMFLDVLRYTVFGIFVCSSMAALGSWAVRTRRISPFSKSAHLIRRATDPVFRPIEQWLLQRGGNPQNAEWWLLGGAVVGGIVVLSLAGWLTARVSEVSRASRQSPFAPIRVLVFWTGNIVSAAIMARVIGSWVGVGRYNRWMRPAYVLTDWIIEPLRKVIRPIGMIDITPIVAFFIIRIGMSLVFGNL